MQKIKDDLLLKALNGEQVSRPPVWMMRQAGRYLPDYQKLRDKYSFFERVETPELATEITIMPVNQIGVDAAILFSDILVIPRAMGFQVDIVADEGPQIKNNIRTPEQIGSIETPDVEDRLSFVFNAIELTVKELNGQVPLIGFAGAPWTIFCYLIEGHGSKTFSNAKAFCYKYPLESHQILQLISNTTIDYLKCQINAGVDAIQLFDSWGGLLGKDDYDIFSKPYIEKMLTEVAHLTPVIVFAKGCWYNLSEWETLGAKGIGIDWLVTPEYARKMAGNNITLQGNLDPSKLLYPIPMIIKETRRMVQSFGTHRYIANLGHGILPNIPVDHARAFVDTVKEFSTVDISG